MSALDASLVDRVSLRLKDLNLKDYTTSDALAVVLAKSVVAQTLRFSTAIESVKTSTVVAAILAQIQAQPGVGPEGLVALADGYGTKGAVDVLELLGAAKMSAAELDAFLTLHVCNRNVSL